ncbi:MAG: peptide synthetase, partial [Candidatus Electrothrix sp. MAN1_4]|nr:peptide synthetase [Candidatus Electrothrix sp. MAN1_4]
MAPPPSYRESNSELDRLVHVYQNLQSPFLLTDEAGRESIDDLGQWFDVTPERIVFVEELQKHHPDSYHYEAQSEDIAFFTLTSGSTGKPKCIGLTHHNMITRAVGANEANNYQSNDVILNWLPFDHIGSISEYHVRCITLGSHLVYAPKEYILTEPLNWLNLIDRYRVTHSWAPNFAYKLVLDALKERGEKGEWDLSCVKALLTAGEAVSSTVVDLFLKRLGQFDFSVHAIQPAFGMAEMGSGVAYVQASPDKPLRIHSIRRSSVDSTEGILSVPETDPEAVSFTSLGPPIPGISLRIVDEEQQLVPTDRVGHLQIRGPAVSGGYYRNPEATAEAFLEDGWFDTGDLGFFADGELIIAGRAKEVIIINGANFANAEIEAAAEKVPGVALSYTAACGVRMPGSQAEELALFFSPLQGDENSLLTVVQAVKGVLAKNLGITPAYLIPLDREEIPKTAIGKIQRKQLARGLESGEYAAVIQRVEQLSGSSRTVPDWFYRRVWQRKDIVPSDMPPAAGLHLILADEQGLADALQTKLEASGNHCRRIPFGEVLTPEHFPMPDASLVHIWHLRDYTPYAGEITDA